MIILKSDALVRVEAPQHFLFGELNGVGRLLEDFGAVGRDELRCIHHLGRLNLLHSELVVILQ